MRVKRGVVKETFGVCVVSQFMTCCRGGEGTEEHNLPIS